MKSALFRSCACKEVAYSCSTVRQLRHGGFCRFVFTRCRNAVIHQKISPQLRKIAPTRHHNMANRLHLTSLLTCALLASTLANKCQQDCTQFKLELPPEPSTGRLSEGFENMCGAHKPSLSRFQHGRGCVQAAGRHFHIYACKEFWRVDSQHRVYGRGPLRRWVV